MGLGFYWIWSERDWQLALQYHMWQISRRTHLAEQSKLGVVGCKVLASMLDVLWEQALGQMKRLRFNARVCKEYSTCSSVHRQPNESTASTRVPTHINRLWPMERLKHTGTGCIGGNNGIKASRHPIVAAAAAHAAPARGRLHDGRVQNGKIVLCMSTQ